MSDEHGHPPAPAVSDRAPGRDLSSIHAGRANSGKWHLTGEYGCPNSNINANINSTQPVTKLSRGTRDWCYYCEMLLEVYRHQAEIDRLEAEVERLEDELETARESTGTGNEELDEIWEEVSGDA